ncbi:MAG: Hsp20/alpha crystallin family protein [Nitrospirae bacterium]|nr:MAG: Hsp20/alpha crystallin family protein [Nitrospirota bacterium]
MLLTRFIVLAEGGKKMNSATWLFDYDFNTANFKSPGSYELKSSDNYLTFNYPTAYSILSNNGNKSEEPLIKIEELGNKTNYPPKDAILHSDGSITINLAVAGFSKEDLDVVAVGSYIMISGKAPKKDSPSEHIYLKEGISKKSFMLKIILDSNYDMANAEADLHDGILSIHVPLATKFVKRDLLNKQEIKEIPSTTE